MSATTWKEVLDTISFLIAFMGGLFGGIKVFENWQQEQTRRAEIRARETSVGAVALASLKTELEILVRAKTDDALKIETINMAVKNLQVIIDMIEKRMLSMFSGK